MKQSPNMSVFARLSLKSSIFRLQPCALQVRFASQYPPHYVEPFITKEELSEIKENKEEYKKLAFCPVKAALNDRTSSVYYDSFVNKFINMLMREGKRHHAINNVNEALYEIKKVQLQKYRRAKTDAERQEIELDAIEVFKQALRNCEPLLSTRRIKRGGATYLVPIPLPPHHSTFLAMKWFLLVVKERPELTRFNYGDIIAKEIINAYNNEGKVIKKKQDLHKQCESNKAYAHYRWA